MALPIIVCLTGIGGLIRYVRGALLDALSMDYVRTARAKGLKEKTVIYKHAFRNAMIPITGWIVGSIVGMVERLSLRLCSHGKVSENF